MSTKEPKARVLAYYLPQFHPIPENDLWWGKGFTEWRNVGNAKPLFPGHYQPRVPADLGYYDLRVPETRKAQADMAREYGVEGFVYWHYWFGNGKRILERPFKEVLSSGEPDFPFALAWANETWSSTMHGLKKGKVLFEQLYPGDEDYKAHFMEVLPAFKDKRYIKCENKPIFIVYLPELVPDIKHYLEYWRELANEHKLGGIYFIALCFSRTKERDTDNFYKIMKEAGFDAVIFENIQPPRASIPLLKRIFLKVMRSCFKWPLLFEYDDEYFAPKLCEEKVDAFPTIIPNWDHTPRSGISGSVMLHSSPERFRNTVKKFVKKVSNKPEDKRFIIIKSWNEWGEGNYLEPDLKYGYQWLEALRKEVLE